MKTSTLLIVILFATWLTITTGLALIVNHGFFELEAIFVSAWILVGFLLWATGALRPGGSH